MIARSTKPNRCKHCRIRMPEEFARHVIHDECIAPWLEKQNGKKAIARKKDELAKARIERVEIKKRRASQKDLADWYADAQKAVNAFIRLRDAGLSCVSCPAPWAPDFQAGHYRSRGAAKHLALDPRNIHGQCIQCNLHKHSNAVEYRIRLVERYGLAFVEAIEADNAPRHYSVDDLKAIRADFIQRTKQLQKEQP
ncbi:recombination protein NinG [Variovorax sp. PAMC 28711]|uniref:recombination protein NinG n=1 Tax=Variovorax sp. PAMC 28711 TaxID=1795631 RepID=UPI00078DB340|nr:recombination protein NinG [Variovorax sp. PAMC 28711]AMM23182.1 hypothetical protein AX767_01425 [Variovorax sp. PAMC 28711]